MMNDLLEEFQQTRKKSLEICAPLEIEDYVLQPAEFASPAKWHLGHTTWFFETFFLANKAGYKLFHPDFNFVFNSYYESLGKKVLRHKRGDLSRPTVKQTLEYRKYVDQQMVSYLTDKLLSTKEKEILEIGIHHEKQHQELLYTDLKYSLANQPLQPIYKKDFSLDKKHTASKKWIAIENGLYKIGNEGNEFCYDNETPIHQVYIADFTISASLVTNAEYIEFIESGGYKNVLLWHAEAWDWLQNNQIEMPLYWKKIDGKYYNYNLSGSAPIELNMPVNHVSYYEAFAFAQWKKMRLPTEFEWEIACGKFSFGERWEWTESAYQPYPGYKKEDGALGEYNGKFMVNQKVLRGFSVATSPNHARKTYRNFFHPDTQWQFTGIRLAK